MNYGNPAGAFSPKIFLYKKSVLQIKLNPFKKIRTSDELR